MKEESKHDRRGILKCVTFAGAGVLNRVLLVYEEFLRRLSAGRSDLEPASVGEAAGVIQAFIEVSQQRSLRDLEKKVAGIERRLGIYELAKFTPAV